MSTLAVVEEILRETKVPMSVRQIVEYAAGRLPTRSKTPDTVVARDLSMDIKKKGEASLFIRTSPGRYTIRAIHLQKLAAEKAAQEAELAATPTPQPPAESAVDGSPAVAEAAAAEDQVATSTRQKTPPSSVLASAMRAERAGPLPARSPSPSADEQLAGT